MNPSLNSTRTKLEYMKYLVTYTMSQLADEDTLSVVTFSENALVRGHSGESRPYYWKPANSSNVQLLIDEVNALQSSGRSNWMEGFDVTFNLIDESLRRIVANNEDECKVENVALMFFSDGDMNLPAGITGAEVTKYVETRIKMSEAISTTGDFHIHPFLYTLGNASPKQVAKDISCASNGIWRGLTEEVSAQNVTYGLETLFSTPMGDNAHMNFTTWSEPYTFTSSGETGV